ncbi:uncharacterized protein LOC134842203 [Symsagittifera roscoffensis]|uniref:uncharacterized protein LOC134842203 n=1 Tax=Symsagittifera roscoffensis TaxID=84072 RepID=UPI00307CBE53
MNYTIDVPRESLSNGALPLDESKDVLANERERLLIQQAYETGYIHDATRDFILQRTRHASIDDVITITLRSLKLRDIGGVQFFYRLTVCNLSGNFITDISPLLSCPHLAKVDLSSNQITNFPHLDFWASFSRLRMLLLHDNGIGRLSCVQALSFAPSIEFLTLFDTPLSIRPSYRHHVVNSITTLKVLDCHVVSDEEVIEDAHFTSDKFKTQADTLYLPLAEMLTVPKKQSNEESEISSIYKTVTRTNQILAKYSPVLLIQKTVRGFFARKFKRYLVENRIWIPKDIMDDDKEIREVSDLDTSAPPAPPLVEQKSENIESNKGDNSRPGEPRAVRFEGDIYLPRDSLPEQMSTLKIVDNRPVPKEYTSLLPEPPVSTPKIQTKVPLPDIKSSKPAEKPPTQIDELVPTGPTDLPVDEKSLKRLQFLLQNVNPEDVRPFVNEIAQQLQMPGATGEVDWLQVASGAHHIKVEKRERLLNKVKQAEEQIHQQSKTSTKPTDKEADTEVDEQEADLNMQGFRVSFYKSEPLKDYLMRIMQSVNDVRTQHEQFHKENDNKVVPKAPKFAFTTLDQLVYAKHKGVMSLATFLAVDKAYLAKDKEEKLLEKQDKAYEMRLEKKKVKQKMIMQKRKRAKQFSNQQDYDETITRAAVRERQDYYSQMKEKYKEQGELREKSQSKKREDFKFAQEFASHCSSIGNALRKHDLKVRGEDRQLMRSRRVKDMQVHRDDQRTLIKNYVAQRQKVLQAESNAERTEIELKIMQESKARKDEIKDRVEELKSYKREVKELYPVPLHIHVGKRPDSEFNMAPNDSLFSIFTNNSINKGRQREIRSPLTRLAEKKILTNKSYDVIAQRVRSAGSNPASIPRSPAAAVVHVNMH